MKRYILEEKAEILKEIKAVGNVHAVCLQRRLRLRMEKPLAFAQYIE